YPDKPLPILSVRCMLDYEQDGFRNPPECLPSPIGKRDADCIDVIEDARSRLEADAVVRPIWFKNGRVLKRQPDVEHKQLQFMLHGMHCILIFQTLAAI